MKIILGLLTFVSLSLCAAPAVEKTVTGVKLERDGKVLWNLEIDTPEGRPFFHPLCLPSGRQFTDCRPKDHVWHLGWWFSWKYINKVNYWEPADEKRKGVAPAGETRLVKQAVKPAGAGCEVKLELAYGPRGFTSALLVEKRNVEIAPPDAQGGYVITVHHEFTAAEDCVFDRTPPHGSVASGKWGGGYAGPTLRLTADVAKAFSRVIGSAGGGSSAEVTGVETKMVELSDPESGEGVVFTQLEGTPESRFYVWPDRRFTNASPVYTDPVTLHKGEVLRLAYRLEVHGKRK